MTYQVRFTQTSLRQFDKLEKSTKQRITSKLESIAEDPLANVKRLRGVNVYSLRVGDYRAILSIENKIMLILVLVIGHRSTIYRNH